MTHGVVTPSYVKAHAPTTSKNGLPTNETSSSTAEKAIKYKT